VNLRKQRWCAWCGPALILVFVVGFWPVAGFVPPSSPLRSPEEIAEFYRAHTNAIRVGLLLGMFACCWIVPWVAALTAQLRLIEGQRSALAYAQLGLGSGAPVWFIVPCMAWLIAAYRPDTRSPELTYLLHDIGWLIFIVAIFIVPPWLVCVAVAVLGDRRADPVFPRWVGYFCLMDQLIVSAGALAVFFKSGPLAWNGVIGFYCVFGSFAVWVLVMSKVMLDVVARQEREEGIAGGVLGSASV
jgi:hypothetical protein